MLGIQKIVSIKEYDATHKLYFDKCELYEWNHTIVISVNYMNGIILSLPKVEISIYYVMDALGSL